MRDSLIAPARPRRDHRLLRHDRLDLLIAGVLEGLPDQVLGRAAVRRLQPACVSKASVADVEVAQLSALLQWFLCCQCSTSMWLSSMQDAWQPRMQGGSCKFACSAWMEQALAQSCCILWFPCGTSGRTSELVVFMSGSCACRTPEAESMVSHASRAWSGRTEGRLLRRRPDYKHSAGARKHGRG